MLSDFFDQTSQIYGQAIQGQLSEQDKRIVEFQLAWLVYIIGAAIGGRVSINSSDEQDALDGNLIIKGIFLIWKLKKFATSFLTKETSFLTKKRLILN